MRRLIGFVMAMLLAPAVVAQGQTVRTVCQNGCDHTKIQEAVNASQPGDTVQVQIGYSSVAAGEAFPIQTLTVPSNLTITGVPDTGGTLPTITFTGPANDDVLIVVSPGSTVSNLKIGRNGPIPVKRTLAAGSVTPGVSHLDGLTISNVVIDFTGSSATAGTGFDFIADNVTIQNSTVTGLSGNAIFVDGNNYTIENNMLLGIGAAAPGDHIAIGFGDDIRATGVACSGVPNDFRIRGNTIAGFKDGIVWCTGANNLIENNTFADLVARAIETAGSQSTVIQNNQFTWSGVPGDHAIGLSSNSFQACTNSVISGNTITGRPALDTPVAIVMQGCTNTQIVGNTVRNFAGSFPGTPFASIGVSLFGSPGLPTTTLIQGNTVQNGGTTGIAYFGSDSGGTAVDHSLVLDNVVENHGGNGIGVQFMRGSGNRVAGNTVRNSNLMRLSNVFGVNVQNVTGTVLENNQAFDTKSSGGPSSGSGFFLGFTTNVTGGCNTGTGNEGGLLQQFNVTPPFANSIVNCPGVTPPSLTLALNGTTLAPGDTLTLTATLTPGQLQGFFDAYFVVLLEDGTLFSLTPTGLVPGVVPYARNFPAVSLSAVVLQHLLTGGEPAGTHRWLTGLTQTGTLTVVGTVDEDPFTLTAAP